MSPSDNLLSSPEFLDLVRRSWLVPLRWEDLADIPMPDGLDENEVWESLTRLRQAQAYRSPQNMRTASGFVGDWHTMTESLRRTLFELDRKTRRGSSLDELARARDSRAFVTQQYVEETVCNLRFDGYDVEYEDARAVLLGERAPLADGERIAANYHDLMHELPALTDRGAFDMETLEGFYAKLQEGVRAPEPLADHCGSEGSLPRSPLEEHYVEVIASGQVDRASLQMPVDVANGRSGDPERHPIMASMLVNCQFWRAPLFPSCNNMMGCIASRYYLAREGYPVFRFVPKIRILEKWKHGLYKGVAKFTYGDALNQVARDKDWTMYYDAVMGLMLHEVDVMERSLLQRAALDDEALDLVERIPYLAHRQHEVLRRAILVPGAEFTIAEQKARYGVVYSTARADLEELVERGLLDRIQRGQAFVYKAASGLRDNLRAP